MLNTEILKLENSNTMLPLCPEISSLIERVGTRDQEAFKILFDQFRSYVLALARDILDSELDIEEVVQDVFLGLWLRPPATRYGMRSMLAWLAVTTKKQCWLRFRRMQNKIESTGEYGDIEYLDPVLAQLIEIDFRQKIERELSLAPKKHSQVLQLAYYDNMGPTEIANQLGLPVITVRKRLDAAVSRLQRHFGFAESQARLRRNRLDRPAHE